VPYFWSWGIGGGWSSSWGWNGGDLWGFNISSGSVNDSSENTFSSFSGFTIQTNTGVTENYDCSQVFSWTTFLYWQKISTVNLYSNMAINLSSTPWTCSLLWADVCLFTYNILNNSLNFILDGFDYAINTVFSFFLDSLQYIFVPSSGGEYCFMWEKFTYTGKPIEYISYKDGVHAVNIQWLTSFDYFFISVLVIAMLIVLFK